MGVVVVLIIVVSLIIKSINSTKISIEKQIINTPINREISDDDVGLKGLMITNNSVVDTTGRKVVLIGVTTDEFRFHPMKPDIELLKKHLLEVKSWGVNLVVLYLQQPLKVDRRVDEIVELANWAAENKMYTLIFPVVHEDDYIPPESLGLNKSEVTYTALGKNTETILNTLSEKLKNNKGVIYGMGAEHHNVDQNELYKRQLEMVNTVRNNSPEAVVVINGMEYGHFLDKYLVNPPLQPNILYDLHQYVASSAKDIDITKCKMPTEYLGRLPLILGEFGGAYFDEFGSYKDLECISSFIFSVKRIGIGFVVHTIDHTSRMGLFDINGQITSKGKLLQSALSDINSN
jgi:hypothetical protein